MGNSAPRADAGRPMGHNDSGGASRFFPVFKYQAKAPKKERPVIEREDGSKIQHPTVKPLALLSWLTALIVPPGGTVLDPFAGSGTTLPGALVLTTLSGECPQDDVVDIKLSGNPVF